MKYFFLALLASVALCSVLPPLPQVEAIARAAGSRDGQIDTLEVQGKPVGNDLGCSPYKCKLTKVVGCCARDWADCMSGCRSGCEIDPKLNLYFNLKFLIIMI